jgi:hypothetical protein
MRTLVLLAVILALPRQSAALVLPEQVAVATRTPRPPKIDGNLSDPVWAQAVPFTDFTQQSPDEGEKPSQKTEVRILYDNQGIYFGIRCFDSDPKTIVASKTRRDRDSFSDAVWLDLDTRGDGRSAWHFEVSAAGVQRDGIRTGDDPDNAINWDWDATWDSAVRRDSEGWTAEIAISLAQLRYKAASNVAWRMEIRRFIARRSEIDQWIYISRLDYGEMLRYGRLVGLSDLPSSHAWHLAPFVVGKVRNRSAPAELQLPQGRDSSLGAGLDARYNITPNITLTATVLPDFGQVEADEVKLNLTTFELRYPEKRPFFLEGADLFTMFNMFGNPTIPQLAYSRRIGAATSDPALTGTTIFESPGRAGTQIWGAAKLAGRVGSKLNVAILDSVTAPESATIVDANGMKTSGRIAPLTNYFISRFRSDLSDRLTGSAMFASVLRGERKGSLGFHVCQNGTPPASDGSCPDDPAAMNPDYAGIKYVCPNNKAPGADGRCTHDATTAELDLRYTSPDSSWLAFAAILGSVMSGGPTRTFRDGTPIGPGDAGLGVLAQAANTAGHWTNSLLYLGFSPRLDLNDAGYMGQQNTHVITFETGWREFNQGPTRKIYAAIHLSGDNSWDGVRTARQLYLLTQIDWNNVWYTELQLKRFPTIFDNRETADGARTERPDGWGIAWTWRTDRTRPFYSELIGSARNTWQGYSLSLSESAVYRPSRSFEISLAPTLNRVTGDWRWVKSTVDNSNPDVSLKTYYFGQQDVMAPGVTLRTLFTFTPTMTLQTYAQLFFSSVRYGQLRETTRSDRKPYLYFADLVPSMGTPSDFDTRDALLNLNAVFRWEYRPGSFLYLVYTRSQAGGLAPLQQDATGQPIQPPRLDFGALRRGPSENILELKLSYDFAG